jgi:PAS domain S-box-containing protein
MSPLAPPFRILILEDRAEAAFVERELRRAGVECVPHRVETEAEFLAALDPPPDLILADHQLPAFDALAALRALRALGLNVPLVVVSKTFDWDGDAVVQLLREGATDYLFKDRMGRLGLAVRNAVERARLRAGQALSAEALRVSEERYRSLFDEAPHPMWMVDGATLRFLEVNRRATDLYGYSRQEFLAMTILDIRPPEEVAGTLAAVEAALAGAARSNRRRHRAKSGRILEVSVASRPVSFAGRPALLAIVDDVTESHRLEQQLRQAQKMEAIGQLAGGVAHDFNNLLTAILGYTELLTDRVGDRPDLVDLAEQIRQAGERAADLTRQLLAFSRQQALRARVLDLNEVVVGVEPMLRRLLGEHLGFILRLAAGACPVLVDRGQLEQVIVNLAVNARDAMPDGGELTIETTCVELAADADPDADAEIGASRAISLDNAIGAIGASGGAGAGTVVTRPHVVLAVSDTGIGMDAEMRAHIFEPFFTTKEAGRGTGLGLATVHGIVHQSGGRLEVVSEPGRGSTFRIVLPRAVGALDEVGPPLAAQPPRGEETVLVLEDDPAVRVLACTALEDAGYAVLAAADAATAIALAANHPGSIHLLLCDVVLPALSGPEAAARIVALRPAIRLLFTSGYPGGTADRRGLLAAGGGLLHKPFNRQTLLVRVREALDAAG